MTNASNTSRALQFALSLSVAGAAFLGGCNTYEPELGSAPFRCGLSNPRCPEGYQCVTYSAADEICERIGGQPGDRPGEADAGGDVGPVTCNDDSLIEPNESISDPTLTSIPEVQPSARLVSLAICPSTDQDFFKFEVTTNGTNVTAEIEYQAASGLLALDVLNNSGVSISSAQPVAGNGNILRAAIPNLPIGIYFAQVRAAESGVENNYVIEIITSN